MLKSWFLLAIVIKSGPNKNENPGRVKTRLFWTSTKIIISSKDSQIYNKVFLALFQCSTTWIMQTDTKGYHLIGLKESDILVEIVMSESVIRFKMNICLHLDICLGTSLNVSVVSSEIHHCAFIAKYYSQSTWTDNFALHLLDQVTLYYIIDIYV